MIPRTITENAIVFFYKGKPYTFAKTHNNYNEIVKAIAIDDLENLDILIEPAKFITKISFNNVVIDTDDNVRFKGEVVPEYLATRIVKHYNEGGVELIKPLLAFAEKLMANPNREVREDLYKWVERGNMPICENGNFIAYKIVKGDYSPLTSYRITHGHIQKPGMTITMPRNMCNENRNTTCSSGLHFCSLEYLPNFGNYRGTDRILVLEVNPEHVVAIPTDYNLSKGRSCEIIIKSEIAFNDIKYVFGDSYVVSSDAQEHISTKVKEKSKTREGEPDKKEVEAAISRNNGNKTAAAKELGISRKVLYRILK